MDVHRSRFVPCPVRAITAIAFSRATDEKLPDGLSQPALRLVIGRENGQIEVWNPLGGQWVQEVVFPSNNRSIDGLLWTREPDTRDFDGHPALGQCRLFSISSSPDVTEWDLERGVPRKKSTGNFSEVWCFAAQPRREYGWDEEQNSQDIVAGCGDGTIVLLSTADNDIQFQRYLARVSGKKAKCISLTYQTRDRIIAGFADSNIRVIDCRNGSIIRTMNLGNGLAPAPKSKFVWKVKCLPNGDIVSGDSNGDVTIWDGRSYSLNQRLKGHDSDCIDIVPSADGKTVVSGSLEGRIAVYRNTTNPSGRNSWAKVHQRRIHAKSEVKAMSVYDSKDMSVVISGGGDLTPTVVPLREYGKENPRSLSHLPQRAPMVSAQHARLLVSWWNNIISIWRIARQKAAADVHGPPSPPRKLVARLVLKTTQDITSVAISQDGKVLAAATVSETTVFQLRKKPVSNAIDVRSLDVPKSIAAGARLLQFSPDGKWLATASLDNEIHIIRLNAAAPKRVVILDQVTELERQQHSPSGQQSAFRGLQRTVTRMAFSADGRVLVAGGLSGYLDAWALQGREDLTAPPVDRTRHELKKETLNDASSEDSSDDDEELFVYHGQHWSSSPASHLLPRLDSAPLVLSFRPSTSQQPSGMINGNPGVHSTRHNPHAHSHELPSGQHKLWVMTVKHQMYEFDVLEGRLSEWSRNNPTSALPEEFKKLRERVMDVVWDVSPQRERLWLYGSNWICMLNVSGDIRTATGKKRRSSQISSTNSNMKKQKTSGAGSKTLPLERDGLPARMLRYEDGKEMDIDFERRPELEQDDSIDDLEDRGLIHIRSNTSEGPVVGANDEAPSVQERTWWCTFKYRPILGMVPLKDEVATEEDPLEVVIVERPVWDILE